MFGTRTHFGSTHGQASVEFVAVLPALAVILMIAAQTALAGWALWAAGVAARAGARAEAVGSDASAAARISLPAPLRTGAVISDGRGVRVSVQVPALVPGVTLPRVSAASRLLDDQG